MKSLLNTIVIACALATSVNGYAGGGHTHNHGNAVEPAPHGGTLRDAPPYKAEAVMSGDLVKIYLYDAKLKPLKPQKPTMDGEIEMPKKKAKEIKFKNKGEFYEATVAGIGKAHRYDLVVEYVMDGKKVLVDFGVDNIDQ